MAKLIASRGAQWPLVAEFVINFGDTMVDVNGATVDFKTAGTKVIDAINLPANAIILNGDVITETAVAGSTAYNISVGDATTPARYLGVTDKAAAGRTPLVLTGYVTTGAKLRLTVSPVGPDATAGKVSVRVMYVIRNRVNEVQSR